MTLRVWEVENERAKKFPCNHGFLIRRLENLYGKPLGGQVQETLQNLKVKLSFNQHTSELSFNQYTSELSFNQHTSVFP